MVLDGMTATAGRPRIPPIDTYLRAVLALGFGSLRHALPALGFLYFYRLGMGLWLAFSTDSTSPLGIYNERTLVVTGAMQLVAYLPLMVLIYTPFLPLQDSILRGQRRSFGDSVRMVLERLIPFGISSIAQITLLFAPPVLLFWGAAILATSLPGKPDEMVRLLALATIAPCVLYVIVIGLFLLFAIPSVVLDERGPFAAIRTSFAIVGRHFGSILGRLFIFTVLLVLAAIAGSLPEAFLQAASAAAGIEHPAIKIAGAVWGAAVAAFLFPFSVAALMVLYRAAIPATAIAAGSAAADGPADGEEARPAASPFRFE
jgi:hypothetical protein